MLYVKSVLAGFLSAVVLSPIVLYGYIKWLTRNIHSDGLIAFAGGPRYEWLSVPILCFLLGAGLTYGRATKARTN